MGTDKTGEAVVINTRGCPTCHAVELCDFELLRSGFSPEQIEAASEQALGTHERECECK